MALYELDAKIGGPRTPLFGDDKALMRAALILGAVLAFARLYIAFISNPIWEEGHFAVSGDYPAMAYPDIPAGFAWLSTVITALFGWSLMAHRLVSFFIGTAIAWGVYWMALAVTTKRNATWAAIIALFLPPVAFNGTVYYPEGSLQLCLVLMLGCVMRAINAKTEDSSSNTPPQSLWGQIVDLKWWILTGLCAGIGLLIHYRFLGPGLAMVIWLLATPVGRQQWRQPGLYVAGLIAVLGLVPALLYNASHDWPAIQFHVQNRPNIDPKFSRFIGMALSQIALGTPLFFIALTAAGVRTLRHEYQKLATLLAYQAFVMFAFYVFQGSINKKIMPHWPFMSFLPLLPLAPQVLIDFADRALSLWNRRFREVVILTGPLMGLALGISVGAYQWAYAHSAEIPYSWRQHNILKNEDWRVLETDLTAAHSVAQSRFGKDVVYATDSHMSATHMEFPFHRERRFFTMDENYDVAIARFVVARHDWGLDFAAFLQKADQKGVVLVLNEPFYIYHQPEQTDMYGRLCRYLTDVQLYKTVTLMPGRTVARIYTAKVNKGAAALANAQSCAFYPKLYIAQPIRGEFLDKDTDGNYYGIAADPIGVKNVDILIDGNVVTRANYGLDTKGFTAPIVLNFDPNYPKVQYDFKFPKGSLTSGQHELKIRATLSDGTTKDGEGRILYVN